MVLSPSVHAACAFFRYAGSNTFFQGVEDFALLPKESVHPIDMTGFEKFSDDQLMALKIELMQSGLDSFQAAELLAAFLVQHGYGVSNVEARKAASRMESKGFSLPLMQEELERIAYVT